MARVEKLSEDELRNELDTLAGWSLQTVSYIASSSSMFGTAWSSTSRPTARVASPRWMSSWLGR